MIKSGTEGPSAAKPTKTRQARLAQPHTPWKNEERTKQPRTRSYRKRRCLLILSQLRLPNGRHHHIGPRTGQNLTDPKGPEQTKIHLPGPCFYRGSIRYPHTHTHMESDWGSLEDNTSHRSLLVGSMLVGRVKKTNKQRSKRLPSRLSRRPQHHRPAPAEEARRARPVAAHDALLVKDLQSVFGFIEQHHLNRFNKKAAAQPVFP